MVPITAPRARRASRFTVHIMAAVAEQEGIMIAARIRAGMATAKARGTVLGLRDDKIAAYAREGAKASAAHRSAKAAVRSIDLLPVIRAAQAEGAASLRKIAARLNEEGIPVLSFYG